MFYTFSKSIDSDKLKREIATANLSAPQRIDTEDLSVYIFYAQALSEQDAATLTTVVNNHVKLTTSENLSIYLDSSVFPFVKNLITSFAAENIAMGITQAGKTGAVLGMFARQHNVNNDGIPFSLKDAFDTGSLYEALKVLQFIRNDSNLYTGMSPFVTDARLLQMKNKIETFLGVPLSL